MEVVEVAFKLDKDFNYYDELLIKNGFSCTYKVVTHDIYFTKTNLDGMSEKDMKNACIRLRSCNNSDFIIQNNYDKWILRKRVKVKDIDKFINKMIKRGYKMVFDTNKNDYHYRLSEYENAIQIQDIDNIGLVLYYDNSEYYGKSLDEQRKLLIDELNKYGFNFNYDDLGFDKLRSLYYKKDMFSINQDTTYDEQYKESL